MAYRRKQSMTRSTTFEEYRSPPEAVAAANNHHNPPPSLAAQAIRASSAHRDSSLSSAYGESAYQKPDHRKLSDYSQDSTAYEYTSMNSLHESKHGFWGVLARKAKAILEDNNGARQFEDHGRNWSHMLNTTDGLDEFHQPYRSSDQKMDNPIFQKGSESIASSLNYIGGTIKNALEEGRTIVENKTADIIQETRKLQIRRKSSGYGSQNQATDVLATEDTYQSLTGQETQLKASRDVANAMAAKAKLLLRELKTVKADLTFSKERCAQLEEENKILRESRQKRDNHADDDLIRLQLETLLAEKGRLAHENSVYARENRFLREIVEYHQLTMQDVVYLDEDIEEVTEVNPIHIPSHSLSMALHAPSPAFSTPSTPTSEPTTPSRDPVVSSDACSVTVDTALVCADSSPSSSPTVGVRQRHGDLSPSSSPTAEGMRKKRSPNHQDN